MALPPFSSWLSASQFRLVIRNYIIADSLARYPVCMLSLGGRGHKSEKLIDARYSNAVYYTTQIYSFLFCTLHAAELISKIPEKSFVKDMEAEKSLFRPSTTYNGLARQQSLYFLPLPHGHGQWPRVQVYFPFVESGAIARPGQ